MNYKIMSTCPSLFWRLLFPRSLLIRLFYVLFLALFVANLISGILWSQQTKKIHLEGLNAAITSMIDHTLYSYNFIHSIPEKYRNLLINQQIALGETHTFISINHHLIKEPEANTAMVHFAKEIANNHLNKKLTENTPKFHISVIYQSQLRVFNSETLMSDLPSDWNKFSPQHPNNKNIIFVVQAELEPSTWLFMASQLPVPYEQIDIPFINSYQWSFMIFSLLMVLLFSSLLIKKELLPLKKLAQTAERLSSTLDVEELEEKGSEELVTAIHAFNQMQNRLRSYLYNREILFTAISHDLKTPLTRLKLRVEMMDEGPTSQKLMSDLDDLELMIKSALQSMKQTDIHENFESIDIIRLLKSLVDPYPNIPVFGKPCTITARPLALKRCFSNIIDNAVKYGHDIIIVVNQSPQNITITVTNKGKTINYDLQEKIFSPYFRLNRNIPGSGLGLTIARNIARSHGGDVTLNSHADQITVRIILNK